MKYIFSYHAPRDYYTIVRRPWWNFWGRDTLKKETRLTRFVTLDIPDDEAMLLLQNNPAAVRLIKRLIPGIEHVQLEYDNRPMSNNYIPTTSNLVRNSK